MFVLVIVLTIVQGSTLPLIARWLGLSKAGQTREVDVDAAPLDELGAVLLTFTVPLGSKMHGVYLSELRLPVGGPDTGQDPAPATSTPTPDPTTANEPQEQPS